MLTIPNTLSIVLRALRRSFAMSLLLCICVGVSAAQYSLAEVSLLHKEAPEFTRTDLENRKLDLRAYLILPSKKVLWGPAITPSPKRVCL